MARNVLPQDNTGGPMFRSKRPWLVTSCALAALAGCGKSGGTTTTTSGPLCASDPGRAPLRRLTRFEYGRSLAALTGVDPSIADKLPPDEETMDFDDIAVAYSVSAVHAATRPAWGRSSARSGAEPGGGR
jgi:hypothetical protein